MSGAVSPRERQAVRDDLAERQKSRDRQVIVARIAECRRQGERLDLHRARAQELLARAAGGSDELAIVAAALERIDRRRTMTEALLERLLVDKNRLQEHRERRP